VTYPLDGYPSNAQLTEKGGATTAPWVNFLQKLFNVTKLLWGSGTTAQRPTAGLYVGLMYFDTTLALPVFVKSLNPTVWVNAAGAIV
jgi:hypothetical protein